MIQVKQNHTDSITAAVSPQPSTQQFLMLRQLHTYYSRTLDDSQQQLEEVKSEMDNEEVLEHEIAEIALISTMSGGRDPLSFEEAWNHPDPTEQQLWREAIQKKFGDMKKQNAWKIIPKDNIPPN